MTNQKSLKPVLLVFIIVANILLDQLSKIIVRKAIAENEVIQVFKNYFILTKVENTGAFLSAGNNLPDFLRVILLTILPIVVLLYGLWFVFKHQNIPALMQIGICFLIGGGIGNIFDRVLYGSVTDFLFMDFVIFRTGVFNVADMSIMVGIGLLLLQNFTAKSNEPSK
jgi:signal peptidase II